MPLKAELARDAALIWMGNQQRPRWTKELFRPYVVIDYADGHLIYQEAPAPADFSITSRGLTIPCQKGIYIVRVGPHTIKLPIL